MAFLDSIERLISEHGSASILRERIALANDQYAILERKVSELTAEVSELKTKIAVLQAENERLQLDLQQAHEKIRNLEEQLESRQGGRLEKLPESILQLLVSNPHVDSLHISESLNIGLGLADFHLGDMYRAQLVKCHQVVGEPDEWNISQEGRRYLARHGLLQ